MTNQRNCHACGLPFNNKSNFPCQLPCYHFICLHCRDAQLSQPRASSGSAQPSPQERSLNCPACKTEHKIDISQQDLAIEFYKKTKLSKTCFTCPRHRDQEVHFISSDTGEFLCNHCVFKDNSGICSRRFTVCQEAEIVDHVRRRVEDLVAVENSARAARE